ncbi:hypothetical protein [Burkholderia sola]|uniref:hypothetical protein n=1 Tax=Burkholderia sola TaxID=2843302 RepID=UPI0023DD68A1|nr:hypothetical protein [Burkholderia sola]
MIISAFNLLLVALSVALIAMSAVGAYWLATRHRATPDAPPPAGAAPRPRTPYDDAGWDAYAHPQYSEQVRRDTEFKCRHRAHGHTIDLENEPASTTAEESAPGQAVHCPRCLSTHIDRRYRARKTGRTIGSIIGASGGIAMALSGAEAGAAAGIVAGPVGSIFGGLGGAIIAGLLGSAGGSMVGSAVGTAVGGNGLPTCQCRSCGYAFGASHQ